MGVQVQFHAVTSLPVPLKSEEEESSALGGLLGAPASKRTPVPQPSSPQASHCADRAIPAVGRGPADINRPSVTS